MRILQIGSPGEAIKLLADRQRTKGHVVSVYILDEQQEEITDLNWLDSDIIHLHGSHLLMNDKIKQLINQQSTSVVITLHCNRPTANNFIEETKELIDKCTLVFLADSFYYQSMQDAGNSQWLPHALCYQNTPAPLPIEANSRPLRVLYLKSSPDDKQAIELKRTIELLSMKGHSMELLLEEKDYLSNQSETIARCDIFVDCFDSHPLSYSSLCALAQAKTVLSPFPESTRDISHIFKFAPVLNTDSSNLTQRLESLAREPRCLKDLGMRALAYIQQNHDAKIIGDSLLELYAQVCK